jgi:hypothetical protein
MDYDIEAWSRFAYCVGMFGRAQVIPGGREVGRRYNQRFTKYW